MALATELMASGLAAGTANAIGSSAGLGLAALASNTATGALALVNSYNQISTSGASTNSVLLPTASGASEIIITVATGQTTVNVFPQPLEKIVDAGAVGTAGAAVTLAGTKQASFKPAGNVWFMIRSA